MLFRHFVQIISIGIALGWAADLNAQHAGVTYALIDTASLDYWTAENGCKVSVRDGVLLLESGNGWLRSHQTYADFFLHAEWRTLKTEGYDAGIYLRAGRDGEPFPKRGYQVNLKQGHEGEIIGLSGAGNSTAVRPAGQWNAFDLTVTGETVKLVVNGTQAYEAKGLATEPGHIGLQVEVPEGGQFEFRNIQVTEFDYRALFNGVDFANWEGSDAPAETCWKVADGVLTCVRGKKGPWLRSSEQFDDFNLRIDYRVEQDANSGLYVRVPANGNHHRDATTLPAAGFEVQLIDDAISRDARIKDYQYSASVYDIAGATEHVSRPAGRWNTFELDCRGNHIVCIHNGVEVVDITDTTHPLLALRQRSGYLGLQNHGGGVSFRNIRIGPARTE